MELIRAIGPSVQPKSFALTFIIAHSCAAKKSAGGAEQVISRSLVDATINAFQCVDILVNNAGIASAARVEDMPVAMWDRMMAVNLRSGFLCTHFVLPIMYRQNYGRIISTASQLAYRGPCASNAA